MDIIMTKLGRNMKYSHDIDKKIPYLQDFLNTYSDSIKGNSRNRLIHLHFWLEEHYEVSNLLDATYNQIKLFFENDINIRNIIYVVKRSWFYQIKKYYSIAQEILKGQNKEYTSPMPSLRIIHLDEQEVNLNDLRKRGQSKQLEYSQALKLLNYLYYNKFPYFICIALLIFTGARITEVMSIKNENIELGHTNMRVIHPKSDPKEPMEVTVNLRFFLNKIKGHKYGVYYFPEFFLQYLNLYLQHTKLIYPESDFLFPSKRTESHISTENVRNIIIEACKLLNINLHITPHSFRSLLNKYRTRMGIDPDERSILLNHVVKRIESRFYNKDLSEFAKVQIIYDESFPFKKFIPDPNYLVYGEKYENP